MNTEEKPTLSKEEIEKILNKAGIKTDKQKKTELVSGCLSFIGTFFLQALILYLLWNALMPLIFGLTTVTFWQACGIKLLAGNLFAAIKLK